MKFEARELTEFEEHWCKEIAVAWAAYCESKGMTPPAADDPWPAVFSAAVSWYQIMRDTAMVDRPPGPRGQN